MTGNPEVTKAITTFSAPWLFQLQQLLRTSPHRVCGLKAVLDALSDRWPLEVIACKIQPRQSALDLADFLDDMRMPQIVLRQSSRIFPDCGNDRRAFNPQNFRVFVHRDCSDLFLGFLDHGGIGSSAENARDGH